MAKRTLSQINKELNYLEVAYQRLNIKTIPYQEEKKKLLKEKDKILNMDEKELAKLEREKKKISESSLKGKLTEPNSGKDMPQPTVITGDTDYIKA